MKKLLMAVSLAAMTLTTMAPTASAREMVQTVRYEQSAHDQGRHDQGRQVVEQRRYYSVNGHRYEAQRGPAWRAPQGYHHRAWARGQVAPRDYRQVVVNDYQRYHLARPARGQQYVRVDNDILLVSIASGVIGAVIANAFIN